jgi:hypothetical protein
VPVELAGATLAHLTHVATLEQARVARHAVPGMAGDLAQTLGRPSVVVELAGILYGPSAPGDLDRLRGAQLAGQPVDFFVQAVDVSELTQSLYFSQVLVTELEVVQRAGYPDQFDYRCRVVEYVVPPEPTVADPLAALDEELVAEASSFVDDAQNALEQVSQLTDLLTGAPSFADPTRELPRMVQAFQPVAAGGVPILTGIRDLFVSTG